jgi:integrase
MTRIARTARTAETARSMFSAESAVPTLKPISVVTQKEAVRFAASALVRCGIDPKDITTLREVCKPESVEHALDYLAAHLGGPTRTVENVAVVLAKVAKQSGVLVAAEMDKVKAALKTVRRLVKRYKRDQQDRDQKLLDHLDANPKTVDALLTLAQHTVRRVLKTGRRTYRDALAIQYALILELWLCTSLRLKNMRHLRLDQHFSKLVLDGIEHVVIRIPAAEVKNGKALEHFLNQDTVDLLRLYVEDFLPILTKRNPSVYLFPGRGGQPKTPQVFRLQMNKFVREGTGLDGFHPHAIRKITSKIYLDQDPGGMEVVRRNLGDTEEVARTVYAPRVHRASQRKYVQALENRRLTALASMTRVQKTRKG